MISDGATNQSTNTKKVKNTSQSSGNKAKLKKTYPESFKREVADAALKKGNTLQSVADEYGISPTLVRNWKNKFDSENKSSNKSQGRPDHGAAAKSHNGHSGCHPAPIGEPAYQV
jgi:transposase-like protein